MFYRFLAALCPAVLLAQAPAPPAFEAASVKPTQHGRDANGWSRSSLDLPSPGRLVATNNSLAELIRFAYNVKDYQVSGPVWLNDDTVCFDIAATAPGASRAQMRAMMQSLLAERFHLAAHRETRELPVFHLVAGKGGPKLKATTSNRAGPSTQHNGGNTGGTVTATNVSMADLALLLSRDLKRPVFDKTGIAGRFDFTVQYSESGLPAAIQDQLGLRVESAKDPVEVLVIDHIERRPTDN